MTNWTPSINGSGIPVLNGYLYAKSPNYTRPGGDLNNETDLV